MKTQRRPSRSLAALLLAFGLVSCGDSGPSTTPTPSMDVSGDWDARLVPAETPLPQGFDRATLSLRQSGPDVAGTIQFTGAPPAAIAGNVSGMTLAFLSEVPVDGQTARMSVTVSRLTSTLLSGTFTLVGADADNRGLFEANRR